MSNIAYYMVNSVELCEDCASDKTNGNLEQDGIYPVYSWEDTPVEGVYCDHCTEEIEAPYTETCQDCSEVVATGENALDLYKQHGRLTCETCSLRNRVIERMQNELPTVCSVSAFFYDMIKIVMGDLKEAAEKYKTHSDPTYKYLAGVIKETLDYQNYADSYVNAEGEYIEVA